MRISTPELRELVHEWQALEDAHDLVHPDRGECGGVARCRAMNRANDLKQAIIEQLHQQRRDAAAKRPSSVLPGQFTAFIGSPS